MNEEDEKNDIVVYRKYVLNRDGMVLQGNCIGSDENRDTVPIGTKKFQNGDLQGDPILRRMGTFSGRNA